MSVGIVMHLMRGKQTLMSVGIEFFYYRLDRILDNRVFLIIDVQFNTVTNCIIREFDV